MGKKSRAKKNPQTTANQKPTGNSGRRSPWLQVFRGFIDVAIAAVERLGWPGFLILLIYFFIQQNGTPEQKQLIIDQFVLGNGIASAYPLLLAIVLCALVFFAQGHLYRKRIEVLNHEVERLSKWKSEHQKIEIDTPLHHTGEGPKP